MRSVQNSPPRLSSSSMHGSSGQSGAEAGASSMLLALQLLPDQLAQHRAQACSEGPKPAPQTLSRAAGGHQHNGLPRLPAGGGPGRVQLA